MVGADGDEPRADPLSRRRDARRPSCAVHRAARFRALVWYAGWTDKLAQVIGGTNPVSGPYFNFTIPEPTGVVGVVAPEEPALVGLVRRVAPALCGGNTLVVLAP